MNFSRSSISRQNALGDSLRPWIQFQTGEKVQRLLDGKTGDLNDRSPVHLDRLHLLFEPGASTVRTGSHVHKLLDLLHLLPVLLKPSFQLRNDPFKPLPEKVGLPLPFHPERDFFVLGSIEKQSLNRFRQPGKRGVEIEVIVLGQSLQEGLQKRLSFHFPWKDGAFVKRKGGVWNNELRVDKAFCPQSAARGTSPLGTVEREHPRGDLGKTEPALDARKPSD